MGASALRVVYEARRAVRHMPTHARTRTRTDTHGGDVVRSVSSVVAGPLTGLYTHRRSTRRFRLSPWTDTRHAAFEYLCVDQHRRLPPAPVPVAAAGLAAADSGTAERMTDTSRTLSNARRLASPQRRRGG